MSSLSLPGLLSSPRFPSHYANYEKCAWTVSVPTNSAVLLSFKSMNLEECCDFVYVYEGTTENSKLLETFSGNVIPKGLVLDSSFLVMFSTDGSITDKGFSLQFVKDAGREYVNYLYGHTLIQ